MHKSFKTILLATALFMTTDAVAQGGFTRETPI